MGVKGLDGSIGTEYTVYLKDWMYFNPWDGRREVSLIPESARVDCVAGATVTSLADAVFLGRNGILCATRSFIGRYVGGRPDIVKFQPAGGLQHPTSEYLIIREQDIERVVAFEEAKKD
jgi:hypothetical protein